MSNKRAPVVAAIAAGLVALLAVFFLVLPKRHQVSEARGDLEGIKQQTDQLNVQVQALIEAKGQAPQAHREIREVDNQLPLTVDEPGLILLVKNAVERSGIEFADISASTPSLAASGGFSTIPVTISLEGTYFSLAEFLYRIETLPRAAKALTGSIAPSGGAAITTTTAASLTMQLSLELYTSDLSAGPGSEPGPTSGRSGA